MKFQRSISSMSLLFAGISSVIGSGWLFGPLYAAQIAGPSAIISWVLGGILMSVITLTFAELGSAYPVAGGIIQFAQESHGALVSFIIGWMLWISSVAVTSVETMGLVQYAANYIPSLITSVHGTQVLTLWGTIVAAVLMLIMCVLNCYGASFFSRSNSIITLIKLIVPISTIVLLFKCSFNSTNFNAPSSGGFFPYGWHGIFAALPLGGVIYSFLGSNNVLQLAAESKNPHRGIPQALVGTMIFCVVLYVLLQTVFIGAVPSSAFANGWKHIHYSGDAGPFTGIITGLGITWFVVLLYADAFISPFGTGFVLTAATARVSYGLSEIGFLPKSLKKLTKKGVPLNSMVLNYCIGLLLFLPFPEWQKLVNFIISCFLISYIVGPLSLIVLRKTQPYRHRPFLLPFPGCISLLAFYICNLLIFWTGWSTVWRMMLTLSVGLVVYYYRNREFHLFKQAYTFFWLAYYFAALSIISYLGSFGEGIGAISFGKDFILIGVVTVTVFYLATNAPEPVKVLQPYFIKNKNF